MNPDSIWLLVGGVLSVLCMILYLWGTHRIGFRVLSHFFIGTTCGFFCIILISQILVPWYIDPFLGVLDTVSLLFNTLPLLILSLLLIARIVLGNESLGNIPLGLVIGVTSGLIIAGAVDGTLLSQSRSLIAPFEGLQTVKLLDASTNRWVDGIFVAIGTLSSLYFFRKIHFWKKPVEEEIIPQYTVRKRRKNIFYWVGEFFIAISFAAIYAGILSSTLSALTERLASILESLK